MEPFCKSILLFVFLGMYSKTNGDSIINGYDTDKDMYEARKNLGICPQHNMLFPELTVGEHFSMFGMVSIVIK